MLVQRVRAIATRYDKRAASGRRFHGIDRDYPYARMWVAVNSTWKLTLQQAEKDVPARILQGCRPCGSLSLVWPSKRVQYPHPLKCLTVSVLATRRGGCGPILCACGCMPCGGSSALPCTGWRYLPKRHVGSKSRPWVWPQGPGGAPCAASVATELIGGAATAAALSSGDLVPPSILTAS